MHHIRRLAAAGLLFTLCGCCTDQAARYVYQDAEFGVVGVPENSDRWPSHYRQQAEELMRRHFPEGHEIVRAEEVVEGSRTLTTEGSRTAELTPQLPSDLLRVGKLGHTNSRSQADTVKIKECRIIYRRSARPALPDDFADTPTLTPTQYVDPNEAERRKAAKGEAEPEKPKAKPKRAKRDPEDNVDEEVKGPPKKKARSGSPMVEPLGRIHPDGAEIHGLEM